MSLSVVILAGGQGTRMKSTLPKLLHKLAGKPILEHVLKTVAGLKPDQTIVVYGHKGAELKAAFAHFPNLIWVEQKAQLGSGHAALQALSSLKKTDAEKTLILAGDGPLIRLETLQKLIQATSGGALALVTHLVEDPKGLGRIVRDKAGKVLKIVEEKDATLEQKTIQEINPSIYCVDNTFLHQSLPQLTAHNAQQEYYLTDILALAVAKHKPIQTVSAEYAWEVQAINDKIQLAAVERIYQREEAKRWMAEGVTLMDSARLDIRGDLSIGHDVSIDVNVILEGHVRIGNGVSIGANTYIKDSVLLDNVIIKSNCVIENATLAKGAVVGPFARLRPGTALQENARVGNFVEIKNAEVGKNSKINHLSYVGDAVVGSNVNIGAGVITCNYDGVQKHKTVIGDEAFIGSNAQLIAPLNIGAGVTIGAGTTVTKDVPEYHLIHNRIQHRMVEKTIKE
jgi:bifunctional UDP-N-acetylglucosamine pyrophosphorylase / glucosamine-1-phosphate N-acetyltransferase